MTVTVRVNIKPVLADLEKLGDPKRLGRAAFAVAAKIQDENIEYARETAANKPPPPFYIRGRGTQGKSRLYRTSEQLGQRWRIIRKRSGAKLKNFASYAAFVIGEKQTAFHKARKWPNVPDWIDDKKNQETLARIVARELERDG